MKILFYGDSITDAGRNRTEGAGNDALGTGYVMQIAGRLFEKDPVGYEIINTGISGNRIVDLFARIKADCINREPDVISILIGVNDVWHEIGNRNGVSLDKFKVVYKMLLLEIMEALPNVKIILCEPFVLKAFKTEANFSRFEEVYDYAKAVKDLADELSLYFVPLQKKLTEQGEKYGNSVFLGDGVHPTVKGAALIAKEWLPVFEAVEGEINKEN